MQNPNAPSAAGAAGLETEPAFNVVLAYDEYADGIRAKEFFDALVLDHGESFQFVCYLWKFNVLREPHLFEAAARDAYGADMIVLALRENRELPAEMDSHFAVPIIAQQRWEEPRRHASLASPSAGQPRWGLNE